MTIINLYVCENYAPELISVCEKSGWSDVAVIPFPSMCLDKSKREETARLLTEKTAQNREGVVLCSKNCDILALLPPGADLEIHQANYCFTHFAGEPFINYVLTKGGYIMSLGWLKNWRARIAEAGFDRETAISFYHDFCQEIVFFDAGIYADAEKDLADVSQYLELPYVVIPVGLDYMHLMIEKVLSQRRLHSMNLDHSQAIAEIQIQCAEFGAIFDLMGKIAAYANKRDAIEKVKEIFMMLFGAQQFKYWNDDYDKDSLPKDIKELLTDEQDFVFAKEENRFCIKIKWHDKVFGVVDVGGFLFPEYIEKYLNFAIEIVKICGLVFSNNEQFEKILKSEQDMRYSSTHDALTDLNNRAYINEILEQQTMPIPFTVFMFDIDRLKHVNDQYGHADGDKLITSVAAILKKCFRESDIVARIGGDEFVAILQDIDTEGAEIIKNRIKQQIEIYNQSRQETHLQISFSIGYAAGETSEDTIEEMMKKADELMYIDKMSRRTI
jgi:diguanylate cyclase (GGDEF)-like protein